MATKTRTDLKANFQNGRVPTAQQFADLIDSALIRRDDHFFGQWQPGVSYHHGDVVIHGRTLYMLQLAAISVQKMEKPTGAANAPSSRSVSAPAAPGTASSYCSPTSPDQDKTHWVKLEFDLKDQDWTIVEEDKKDGDVKKDEAGYLLVYSKKFDVGIGFDTKPEAKLDVRQSERGMLQFNPINTPKDPDNPDRPYTELRMSALDYPDCVAQPVFSVRIDKDHTHLSTNTGKGFSLEHDNPTDKVNQPRPLMVVHDHGDTDKAIPRVGIGTADPDGTLHIVLPGTGQLQMKDAADGKAPELQLTHPSGKSLEQSVNPDFAVFTTDAAQGFQFNTASATGAKNGASAAASLVMDEHGHLGIGTAQPAAHLEVKKTDCGALQFCLDQTNPALALLNLRPQNGKLTDKPKPYNTYLTIGADNSYAVLKTDAPCGFVFRRETLSEGKPSPERNINEGEKQVYIDHCGNLGIGTPPEGYELDALGKTRAYESYIAHNEDTIDCIGDLEKGLEIVCGLRPVRYRWQNTQGGVLDNEKEGFALVDYQCEDVVPQVVKTTGKNEKAINYQELVPVLVRAIQQQQDQIVWLKTQIEQLKGTQNGY